VVSETETCPVFMGESDGREMSYLIGWLGGAVIDYFIIEKYLGGVNIGYFIGVILSGIVFIFLSITEARGHE